MAFYSFSANSRLEITSKADIYRKYLLYEIFCYGKDKTFWFVDDIIKNRNTDAP